MVEESFGVCKQCKREDILGDGFCVECWDGPADRINRHQNERDQQIIQAVKRSKEKFRAKFWDNSKK
jgi:galactose mutarotase-like enzyme